MKKLALFFSICVIPLLASQEYTEWSDSGIHGPKYADILAAVQKLQTENTDLTQMIEYGKTVKGRPMRMMVVMKKKKLMLERPTLIMTGSTHGNEYLNLEDRLPEALLASNTVKGFLDQGGAFVFVPILNPDGYEARQRENAHGVDLNRDWDVPSANFKGFKEVETKALADKLHELTLPPYNFKYKISVDYHCCIGALLYPWSYTDKPIPANDKANHVAIAQLAEKNIDIEYGTTSQVLGYYALGTTKDYYYSKYGTLAFTFEGRYGKENKNLDKHVTWWEAMVNSLSMTAGQPLISLLKKGSHPFPKIAD